MKLLEGVLPVELYLLGVIWILREVFGFLHKFKGNENGKRLMNDIHLSDALRENSRILNKILRAIERLETKFDSARSGLLINPRIDPDSRI